MKTKLVIFLFLSAFTIGLANSATVNPDYTFSDYVRQFSKVYSDEEYAKREGIFNANFKKILNKQKDSTISYTVEVNKFTDWTDDEKKSYSTYKPH